MDDVQCVNRPDVCVSLENELLKMARRRRRNDTPVYLKFSIIKKDLEKWTAALPLGRTGK